MDGNAANSPTTIIPRAKMPKERWAEIISNTEKPWWSQEDGYNNPKGMLLCLRRQSK